MSTLAARFQEQPTRQVPVSQKKGAMVNRVATIAARSQKLRLLQAPIVPKDTIATKIPITAQFQQPQLPHAPIPRKDATISTTADSKVHAIWASIREDSRCASSGRREPILEELGEMARIRAMAVKNRRSLGEESLRSLILWD
ncbi:MAG: hypothetical protein M1819_003514 [Sarea resinae]|nr:MAG: hypothetical protein M1819_003514 [Sarea resinae]